MTKTLKNKFIKLGRSHYVVPKNNTIIFSTLKPSTMTTASKDLIVTG